MGNDEGLGDAAAVFVGVALGVGLGDALAARIAAAIGPKVGRAVGLAVGLGDGLGDALGDGLGDGLAVDTAAINPSDRASPRRPSAAKAWSRPVFAGAYPGESRSSATKSPNAAALRCSLSSTTPRS